MAKGKKQSEEVVEVEAEEMPVSVVLQESINQEVKRFDPYEARMDELREKYSALKITSPSDKEGIENNRLALADLRTIRTDTEKERKARKAPFLKACADIESKAQFIISGVEKIEEPLKAQKNEIQKEVERIATEEKERILKRNKVRTAQLSDMGAVFNGVDYVLGDVSYSFDVISSTDADIYDEKILPKYREVFEKNELVRLEQEHLQREEEARKKKEADDLKAAQEEFRKKEAKIRLEQEQREKDEKAYRDRLRERRSGELFPYRRQVLQRQIDIYEIWKLEESEFLQILEHVKSDFDKEVEERAVKEQIEKERQAVAKKEQEEKDKIRIEKEKQEAIEKALADKKEKERLAEIDRLSKLEESNDKVKYAETINYLKATPIYEMRSGQYRSKMRIINDFLSDLK